MYLKSLRIGNVNIDNNVFLAPMAGITDLPFRVLCKEQGAGLTYTEMVSSKGLFYGDKCTQELMAISEVERPAAIQIFGNDPNIMGEIVKKVSKQAEIIDINMGCPAPKVVKNGEGSKLLLNPQLVGQIVKSVVANSLVPVTVKIRKGWDEEHVNAIEVAKLIEESGASAITVHGRTREQFYSGKADWDIIKQVKQNVKIPVIGNGDIVCGEDAKRMFEYTGCDAIMIARASNGNPWIFRDIIAYLKEGIVLGRPNLDEIKGMILRHITLLTDFKGEYTAVREMRKHIAWYIKGIPNAAEIRNNVNKIEDIGELKEFIYHI
ncbi:MAG: tRNA dihydrouridine synthase DusB [Clostridia bacterium]|nr:tRNA dihydrouridine synthase DusB [Clostridia bacterium]